MKEPTLAPLSLEAPKQPMQSCLRVLHVSQQGYDSSQGKSTSHHTHHSTTSGSLALHKLLCENNAVFLNKRAIASFCPVLAPLFVTQLLS